MEEIPTVVVDPLPEGTDQVWQAWLEREPCLLGNSSCAEFTCRVE